MKEIIIEDTVKIKRIDKISAFMQADDNLKFRKEKAARIGASGNTVARMLKHHDELKLIMSSAIGLDKTDVKWGDKVRTYFHSTSIPIQVGGKNLNVALKVDINDIVLKPYIDILKKESKAKIEDSKTLLTYLTSPTVHGGTIDAFSILRYATPINPQDYLVYLYCLNYKDVANSFADVSKSPHIRFVLFRASDEVKANKAIADTQRKVVAAYTKMLDKQEDILNAFMLYKRDEILTKSLNLNQVTYSAGIITLTDALSANPIELYTVLSDKKLKVKALLLTYILAEVITVVPNTSTILANDGSVFGATFDDAVTKLEEDKEAASTHAAIYKSSKTAN